MGVIGMKLEAGDEVVTMQMSHQGDDMLIVSDLGMGKRTRMDEFSPQNRGGKGVKVASIAKVRAGDTSADLETDVLSDDTLEKMKEEQ